MFFLLALVSCHDKKKQKEIIFKTKDDFVNKKIKHEDIKPIFTKNNVVTYLTEYGNKHKENKVVIKTKFGEIYIELFKETPLHRANFLLLTNMGYFNTTCFHRVVKDFIIQAGQSDKKSTLKLRKSIGNYKIPPELNKYKHKKGALSSARRWNDNPKKLSDAYEFFIVHKESGLHHLDNEHTVFGRVTKGLDIIDKIANQPIDKGEWPINDIDLEIIIVKE